MLCAALNELGLQARPALVDTESRHIVADDQPSPYDFNHVIVRAKIGERTYWLDPTIRLQRGTLEHHANPNYGRALVIRDGAVELEEIPFTEVDSPSTEVREVFTSPSYQDPVSLEVVTTYHGDDADAMRDQLSQRALSEFSKSCLSY